MTPLWIERLGVVTSVGLNAAQTMGSLLTLTMRAREIGLRHPNGEAMTVCAAPIDTGIGNGPARLAAMMQLALGECTEDALSDPSPLVLSTPAEGAFPYDDQALLRSTRPLGEAIDRANSKVLPGGEHAAIGRALVEAEKILALGRHRACYVGAVDTLLDRGRLERLMGVSRLLSSLSPDGVIPGEGAAFMRVSADPIPGASVYVAGVELATEEATRASGRMTGRAQAAAARSALAAAGSRIEDVGLLVKDTSGERHRFYETALAVTRLRPSRAQTLPTVTLGSSLGEVGCALGAISVAYAAFAVERGWTPAKTAMYLGASEGSLRAAVVLRKGG